MKKLCQAIFITGALVSASLFAELTSTEKQEKEICLFAQDIFHALSNINGEKQIAAYQNSEDPLIQNLAEKFLAAFEEGATPEAKEAAVSELGCLIKCSVDKNSKLPYAISHEDLAEKTAIMEEALKQAIPKDPNYHKLMIESLADRKWDLALYSYLKIAEDRCLK